MRTRADRRFRGVVVLGAALVMGGASGAMAADEAGEALPLTAGYDKGFFIRSDDDLFEIKMGLRLQGRYTYEAIDEGDEHSSESAFALQRARLGFSGHALVPELGYKLQIDFGKGDVTLKDFYADYEIVDGVQIRGGQFKQPFSRQQITSSGKLEFVDRTIAADELADARDIGIMLHNEVDKAKGFEWAVALFNGTGEKGQLEGKVEVDVEDGEGAIVSGKFNNVPNRLGPLVVGRLGYNDGVIKGYSEADLEGGPLRWGVGGGLGVIFDREGPEETAVLATADYVLKAHGFSTTGAVLVVTEEEPDDGADLFDQELGAVGTYIQLGYLIADRYQPAFRWSALFPDGSDNDTHELTGAFSVYFMGHALKWQNDASVAFIDDPQDDLTDWRLRSQVQLAF